MFNLKKLQLPLQLLLLSVCLFHMTYAINSSTTPLSLKYNGTIDVAFSPNGGVTNLVLQTINQSHSSILVEAYSFTSKEIATALVNAKKRGVMIKIILDKSQVNKGKYSSAKFFANQGFNLHIDTKHQIFHNKVMIIDDNTIITGSFNFTNAAEKKNAENLLVLHSTTELAKIYTNEFNYNWNISATY